VYCLQQIKRHLLIDGSESELEKVHFFTPDTGEPISIAVESFLSNPLVKLEEQLSGAEFDLLLLQLGAKKGIGIIENYTTKTGIELYFVHNKQRSTIVVVSFGEVSPTHFQLAVEAVLEQQESC